MRMRLLQSRFPQGCTSTDSSSAATLCPHDDHNSNFRSGNSWLARHDRRRECARHM